MHLSVLKNDFPAHTNELFFTSSFVIIARLGFFSSSQLLSSFKSRFKNCSFFASDSGSKQKKRDDLTSFNEALGVAHAHLKLTWKEVN